MNWLQIEASNANLHMSGAISECSRECSNECFNGERFALKARTKRICETFDSNDLNAYCQYDISDTPMIFRRYLDDTRCDKSLGRFFSRLWSAPLGGRFEFALFRVPTLEDGCWHLAVIKRALLSCWCASLIARLTVNHIWPLFIKWKLWTSYCELLWARSFQDGLCGIRRCARRIRSLSPATRCETACGHSIRNIQLERAGRHTLSISDTVT